ncbi:NgoBV family restriction endonuclease [Mycoplasma nasistruthionis]|uniref:NgoBV family restriction endonuclease n=2 Tax=Mycoplasma nasistruthionis TaxID=353852 RepID=A0A5B7XWS5_9MOLU|nr:NgoBV family restriction endonuclease [Mycoplasma nasistruthionis]
MKQNDIFYKEPLNTQAFPDFYLENSFETSLLEVKTFNSEFLPAFDIANFDSYCSSLKTKPYILYADYLIFGYKMDHSGKIQITNIWLKKIWKIAGKSTTYPLKLQVKRNIVYNIRPIAWYKDKQKNSFISEIEFINALYSTICKYKNSLIANEWKTEFLFNYHNHFNKSFFN